MYLLFLPSMKMEGNCKGNLGHFTPFRKEKTIKLCQAMLILFIGQCWAMLVEWSQFLVMSCRYWTVLEVPHQAVPRDFSSVLVRRKITKNLEKSRKISKNLEKSRKITKNLEKSRNFYFSSKSIYFFLKMILTII